MGSASKDKSSQTQNSTQTATANPYEEQINKLDLDARQQAQGGLIKAQGAGLENVFKLLSGQDLPGYLKQLPYGIDENVTNSIVSKSLNDVNANLQGSGVGTFRESGTAQAIGTSTAADIRNQASQYNLNNLMNLLSLGLSGQAQVQQPILAQGDALGSRLAGLRTLNQSGQSNTTTKTGFFNTAFAGGLGQGLGTAASTAAFGGCWVASEIFGGWFHPKTVSARAYMHHEAPEWFRNFYLAHGQRIAYFVKKSKVLKAILRPLFEYFSYKGKKHA